jgi:hypothetical protein
MGATIARASAASEASSETRMANYVMIGAEDEGTLARG